MRSRLALLLLAAAVVVGCARSTSIAVLPAQEEGKEPNKQELGATDSPGEGKTPERPLAITWDDLDIPLPADSTYESWMLTSRAKAVLDRYVRITGHMYGGIAQKDAIRTFPLLRDTDCPFGPGGHAHHAIEVNLQGKLRTHFRTAPVTVEGFLTLSPFTGTDGKTWSVYHLEGTKVQ
jgi:hypothetical protein